MVLDQAVDLIDKGIQLVAGCARLTAVELGAHFLKLVDQPSTLVFRERAGCDQRPGGVKNPSHFTLLFFSLRTKIIPYAGLKNYVDSVRTPLGRY